MAKRSPKAGKGLSLDPYSGNARNEIKNMVEQGLISPEDLAELAQELKATRKQTETSVARVLEGQEAPEQAERQLSPEQQEQLLSTVKARFEANMHRHESIAWRDVEARLHTMAEEKPEKMWSLNEMERTGGQPDVVGYDKKTDEYIFYDCSKESPEGRRSICYDREGQEVAESYGLKPAGNAVDMAQAMGIEILGEAQYRNTLQKLGKFDLNTWSWLKAPADIRKTGDALYGYRTGAGVCVFQVSADSDSVYGAFRAALRV